MRCDMCGAGISTAAAAEQVQVECHYTRAERSDDDQLLQDRKDQLH